MRDYIKFLKLKKPVSIIFDNRGNRWADADYETEYCDTTGKITCHVIRIYNNADSRDSLTLLAHELIHAWQAENNKDEIHGPYFVRLARKMEKKFNLREVYLPGIDEE